MKRLTYILGGLILSCGILQADDDVDIDPQNVGSEQMIAQEDNKAFRISARGDWIGKSEIDKHHFHHQHVKFYEAEFNGSAVIWYNRCCQEGLILGVGYDILHFKWDENPYFHRSQFNEWSISLSYFTKRVCGWLWQAQATANFDTKYRNWSDYANYDLVLWGRYDLCCNFGIHAGFVAQTGMKIDKIWPIIGFDWTFCQNWKLNAVFPVNIALVYTVNDCWNVAAALRFFDVRRRVGDDAELEKGLFRYRNSGAELALNYETSWLTANVHGGYTFGGQFIISNKNNKHKRHFDIGSAGYAGGELVLKF